MEPTTKSATEDVSASDTTTTNTTGALDAAVVDERPVEEPPIAEPSEEIAVAEPTQTRGARVAAGLEKSKAHVRTGATLVTRVVKGDQTFDTRLPFVWMLRVAAIVVAVLAAFAPVITTYFSGLLGYIADIVVNLAAAFAIFAMSNVIDVIYDTRDQIGRWLD